MHPTAVLLALRGYVPLTLAEHRRIAVRQADFANALYAPDGRAVWRSSCLGTCAPELYKPASWDIITDAEWDRLPPEMLAEFLAWL